MKRVIMAAAAVTLLVSSLVISCSKDSDPCIRCTAVCNGVSSSEMRDCGEDIQEQEAAFRAANPGCTINCQPE
ncbi:hypothetical protein [Chitinophaga sp. 22620]|uniref:hypothetical protein n=1 Tax=Chitinophaga sp. 22620 TaxID=3453952 RepID=UPI003F854696